jgi:site-specific recombinase XerD
MPTITQALTAYRTYALAEGISPKTIDWVVRSAGYFAAFLGDAAVDLTDITGDDLRRFIIALQSKSKFSNHPYNQIQVKTISPVSIDTYTRGVRSLFAFLLREGFITFNPLATVKPLKVPEIVIPTFNEKEIGRCP